MSHKTSDSPGLPLPAHYREWLRRQIETEPDHVVATRIGLSRLALVRGLAGLPVMRGTHAIVAIAYQHESPAA
jgi:hypothetical protein